MYILISVCHWAEKSECVLLYNLLSSVNAASHYTCIDTQRLNELILGHLHKKTRQVRVF
ncbi:protein of unknown function [Shewanella benthica]|uniref:Uncharacterized protein n=1 Tax=Shewanella benthica TaxID=43661 RepID=A0A330LZY9_9GAMM|nr:protein of unknown function [Shewanella benthica]